MLANRGYLVLVRPDFPPPKDTIEQENATEYIAEEGSVLLKQGSEHQQVEHANINDNHEDAPNQSKRECCFLCHSY